VSAQERPSATAKTRDRIVRAAFQLFHEQGYNGTGVATIVREAGVNPGSLYHFFESKDALLLGVLEFALGYLGEAVMNPVEARTADPVGRVFALLQQYRDRMERERCRLGCPIGNLALEVSDGNDDARRLLHRNFENWASRVEAWLNDAGDRLPPDVDRRRLASFVLTVMEGGLMQSRAAGHLQPFDDSVEVLRDYFRRLAAPAPKTRRRTPAARRRRTRR